MQGLRSAIRELPDAVFVDVLESEDAYRIVADLPGVAAGDVDLTVEAGRLSVTGERSGPLAGVDAGSAADSSDDGAPHAEDWVGDERVGDEDDDGSGTDVGDASGEGVDGASDAAGDGTGGADVEVGSGDGEVVAADEPFEGGDVVRYVQRDRAERLELELPLPPDATGEDATASLDRGVLQVTLPKHSVLGRTDVAVEDA